jgi:hypothetical protein
VSLHAGEPLEGTAVAGLNRECEALGSAQAYRPKVLRQEAAGKVSWAARRRERWKPFACTPSSKKRVSSGSLGYPLEKGQHVELILLTESPSAKEADALTARKLLQSPLVGLWGDRQDIGDSVQYARHLRDQAQHRG